MRAQQADKKTAGKELSSDIMNSVDHIFGNHEKCSDYFRHSKKTPIQVKGKGKGKTSKPSNVEHHSPEPASSDSTGSNEECLDVIQHQGNYWIEGSSLADQEESRGDCSCGPIQLSLDMIRDVKVLLRRLADNAPLLIENATSNLA